MGSGVRRKNAVRTTLKHVFALRTTTWWRNTKATNMKLGIDNHTRWKHKWEEGRVERHNWGKSGAQKGFESLEDRKDFATFALDDHVTQSVAQRPKIRRRDQGE